MLNLIGILIVTFVLVGIGALGYKPPLDQSPTAVAWRKCIDRNLAPVLNARPIDLRLAMAAQWLCAHPDAMPGQLTAYLLAWDLEQVAKQRLEAAERPTVETIPNFIPDDPVVRRVGRL